MGGLGVAAYGGLELGGVRDHVLLRTGVQTADGHHHRIEDVEGPRHPVLQRRDHLADGGHRILGAVRRRPVAALTADRHLQDVRRRHHRPRTGGDPAAGQPVGRDVQGEGGVDAPARRVQDALLDHRAGAVVALLTRLEHEDDIAVQRLAPVREQGRGADEPGRVQIVSAAVHPTGDLGGVREPRPFGHRQGVHVAAQQHRAAGAAAAQHGRDGGEVPAERDVEGEAFERGEYLLLGAGKLEAELRLAVQRAAEPDQIGL